MSIHMPTLFDDEEYFVPPPKKESRKKKEEAESNDEASEDAEPDVKADLLVPGQALTQQGTQAVEPVAAGETAAQTSDSEQHIENEKSVNPSPEKEIGPIGAVAEVADEEAALTAGAVREVEANQGTEGAIPAPVVPAGESLMPALAEPGKAAAPEPADAPIVVIEEKEQITEPVVTAAAYPVREEQLSDEATQKALEIAAENAIELEDNDQEPAIAADLQPEIVEVSAVDELTIELPKAAPGITFEIPEEDETPAIELEMTARPIPTVKEDKVDDLDQLMRTELINQDYTAFSGFTFEPQPEKKKIIPEPETTINSGGPEIIPEKEDMDQAVREIDAAGLDFEFESAALASSLPEFDLENKYYTIGEVAGLFGVNVSHIRFWTTEFNLKVRTTRKGDRLYNPENIARLRLIHHLVKENGFTIKGAKDKLKHQKQNVSSQVDLKNKLSGLKEKLERIKKNL